MRALGLALGGLRFAGVGGVEPETTKGEAECAQWVAEQLAAVGYAPHYVESGAPRELSAPGRRTNTLPRPGAPDST
ncbi:hypothetical protein JHV675_54070 [Mycobacterium avium subsp. hominissuis]